MGRRVENTLILCTILWAREAYVIVITLIALGQEGRERERERERERMTPTHKL